MADNVMQIPPVCEYPNDKEFPVSCIVDYKKAYCCQNSTDFFSEFVFCDGDPLPPDTCQIGPAGCHMVFPSENDEGQPMFKSALSATTKSAWVKVAFQQYEEGSENPDATWETILTMGNESQPFNDEKCMAMIKSFQYAYGTTNQGVRCRLTILDQKGSTFQSWTQRMGINPEGDAVPVQGKNRMKVQWGWYITGGSDEDICGQPAMPLSKDQTAGGALNITEAAEGFNTAFVICSPVLWFITDWINVHFEQGKFVYELEGVDTLVRTQENILANYRGLGGAEDKKMYFTKAVQLLGRASLPPFRVAFKCLDKDGNIVDMQFVPRPGNVDDRPCKNGSDCEKYDIDCEGWGQYEVWKPNGRAPLAVLQDWATRVSVKDLTGKITSNQGTTSYTINYDPTYKHVPEPDIKKDLCPDPCESSLPQYGRVTLWAGNSIPYCQGNFTDAEINKRMKAVYVVNGGNCSPVLQFAPAFRWHSYAAQKAGGIANPAANAAGAVAGAIAGAVKTNCAVASTPGPLLKKVVMPTFESMRTADAANRTQELTYHQVMSNLAIGAVEADLRVEGDPSSWLCTPAEGMGRCVGIVFVNPFFLVHGQNEGDCPVWAANDPDNPDEAFKSICNELLTSKGWWIFGVDHQIKDGNYVTTLKLKLVAPGAEINQAGSIVNLGGWGTDEGTPLPYGGQFACLRRTQIGSSAAGWAEDGADTWVGGGTACGPNYTDTGSEPLPPD